MQRILNDIYKDIRNPLSFSSVQGLYQAAKKKRRTITLDDVKKFLSKQDVYTYHRPIRTKFPTRKTLAKGVDYLHQADLADFQSLSRYNNGYRYLLFSIDVLSRYLFVVPIKKKTGLEVKNAFRKMINQSKRKPQKIQTDHGTEFHNAIVRDYFILNNIIHYSTESINKAALCERVIRTIKSKLYKYMTEQNTLRYINALPEIVNAYNKRKHSAHGHRPKDINRRNEKKIWRILYKTYLNTPIKDPEFRVGDRVRIANKKNIFDKSYKKRWSDTIYIVNRIIRSIPITYKIRNRLSGEEKKGSFYAQQLTKLDII